MKFLIVAVVLCIVGCATQSPAVNSRSINQASYTQKAELHNVHTQIQVRKKQLEIANQKEEVKRLNQEIADLNLQLDILSKQIEESERAQLVPINNAPSSIVHVGPRGGLYTISSSGKKVYVKK